LEINTIVAGDVIRAGRADSVAVGYFEFKMSGNTSFINRMNTAMEIIAIHHGLKIMGKRRKTRMNATQRQPEGLLSSPSIPYAALSAPPLFVGFPEGNQILYAPQPIRKHQRPSAETCEVYDES
jgi:hypothetical protein